MLEETNDGYHRSGRSKFKLKVHLIFVCKYRKKLLNVVGEEMKMILNQIACESDFDIDTMEIDQDHIHMLIDFPPKISISSVVNRLKSLSTNRIYEFNEHYLKKHFWNEQTFWSDGYFVCSVGDASTDTIKKYIEEQG